MERQMNQVKVTTTREGLIEISQPAGMGEPDDLVVIAPGQVPVLVKWLQEAAAELEAES